ncbi:hypothetical protein [Variovorax sp. EL159]|uniref:hypothetical protein n=1 Tax=Variovorax sp. EL159 TaxID=1566270 RepID=UPI00088B36C4|nr:hypothetical protein [Variovorax sp. EL159]SCX73375.1 hypothetical protein SAMN03159363_5104 [Variovorax sp. EL159]
MNAAITRLRPWLLAAGLLGAMAPATARVAAPEVPPQVDTVAAGGEWRSARDSGVLRIVIVHQGFEHVHSRLWIEWLAVGERGTPRRVARVLVKELSNGMNVIDVGNRRETFQDGRIRLRATHTYSHESSDITIETGKPGQYKLL